MHEAAYSIADKLLHRLALGSTMVAELAFDIDQAMSRYALDAAINGKHVFVSGLARSGTTILMREIYQSGSFHSLTYRDMPFVIAPTLWNRVSGMFRERVKGEPIERAHGDRILVNIDSPESLEEVFWRIFDGKSYIRRDRLTPHSPSSDLVQRFQKYVASILNSAYTVRSRYLAKNNNNILRLASLTDAFPRAEVLILFRHPIQHSQSLLHQDKRFMGLQKVDRFVLTYMNWLAHHEFGLGHRPFAFRDAASNPYSRENLNYWLFLWYETYDWLLTNAPDRVTYVCYEDLCSNPTIWCQLGKLCGISVEDGAEHPFSMARARPHSGAEPSLFYRATSVYETLCERSRKALLSI